VAVVRVGGMVGDVREVRKDAVAMVASSNAQRPRSPDNPCRAGSLHTQSHRPRRRKRRRMRIRDDWCNHLCKGIQAAAARARQAVAVVAAEPALTADPDAPPEAEQVQEPVLAPEQLTTTEQPPEPAHQQDPSGEGGEGGEEEEGGEGGEGGEGEGEGGEEGDVEQDETRPEPEPIALAAPPLPARAATSERISSSTALEGSARELVNPDGSLIQPRPRGPLAGLRQRFTP